MNLLFNLQIQSVMHSCSRVAIKWGDETVGVKSKLVCVYGKG